MRRIRNMEPKPLGENKCVLAARMYREGRSAEDVERQLGIPPERFGEAVRVGLSLMLRHPLMDSLPVTIEDPPRPAIS